LLTATPVVFIGGTESATETILVAFGRQKVKSRQSNWRLCYSNIAER